MKTRTRAAAEQGRMANRGKPSVQPVEDVPGAPASGTAQAKAVIRAVREAGAPSKPRQGNED